MGFAKILLATNDVESVLSLEGAVVGGTSSGIFDSGRVQCLPVVVVVRAHVATVLCCY